MLLEKLQAAIVHYNNFLQISQIKTLIRMPLRKYPIKTLLWDITRWSVHVFYISIRQIQFGLSYSIPHFSVLIYVCNILVSKGIFSITVFCYSWRKILALEIDGTLSLYEIILFVSKRFCDNLKIPCTSVLFVNSR